ncbi:hypothetical protein Acr_08g0017440 [Actinidia rufa]|uniref:Uncharacterized protein n=1 Tax=Actinidia rufa TaxID=165716 RepID=A0A7J0F3S9_9ERIC|nr:hypothetical protein Acr_08g0017440 [Actinidia rufa]
MSERHENLSVELKNPGLIAGMGIHLGQRRPQPMDGIMNPTGLALSTKVKLKRTRPGMKVLSIQQHARDTLSWLRMRKRNRNWARLKGGLGGTGELEAAVCMCTEAAQRLDGGCAGRGYTEVWLVAGGGGCLEAGGGCRGCTEAAQEAGLEAVWLRRAAQGVGGCLVAAQVAVQGCAGG